MSPEPMSPEPMSPEPMSPGPTSREAGGRGAPEADAALRVVLVLGLSTGGVGRHVRSLAKGLFAAGDHVTVASPSRTESIFHLGRTGARTRTVDIADRPRPLRDLAAAWRLRTMLQGCDVVHAHGLRAGALAVLAARSRRVRPGIIVTLHNAPVGSGRVALVGDLLERVVARGADEVLTVSPDLSARMRALGARRVHGALVPAPASAATSAGLPESTGSTARGSVRAGLGIADSASLLVTVARLAPQKGLGLLLDAVAILDRQGRRPPGSLVAVVAGDGPLEADLAAQIRQRHLPVRLLGRREDVEALLREADVVVLPSVWEGQPLVAQEALRAGAALVATDVGGTRDVTGDAASLVPWGDAAALAAAVAALLDVPEEAAELRARALERAAELPTEADAVAQVRRVYRRCLLPSPKRALANAESDGTHTSRGNAPGDRVD